MRRGPRHACEPELGSLHALLARERGRAGEHGRADLYGGWVVLHNDTDAVQVVDRVRVFPGEIVILTTGRECAARIGPDGGITNDGRLLDAFERAHGRKRGQGGPP